MPYLWFWFRFPRLLFSAVLSCVQLFDTPSVHGDSPGKNIGVGCHALLQGIFPTQGLELRSPSLQADSLLSEPSGKAKNTGVFSLSLLQGNFPTQEAKRGLLHCRQILYQLSCKGSPLFFRVAIILYFFGSLLLSLSSLDLSLSGQL